MNRRFFLKLFPAASAAVALPAVVTGATLEPALTEPASLPEKWQGEGYYEVVVGNDVCVQSVVRWEEFDHPVDGRCFRFSPRHPRCGGKIVYRYNCAVDAALVRKVGEF